MPSDLYRKITPNNQASNPINPTERREPLSPAFRIHYHDGRKLSNASQDAVEPPFASSWRNLQPQANRRETGLPQSEKPVPEYRRQHQQRWQSATDARFVSLNEQRQNDAVRARFARRACFRCGSTEHLAKDCAVQSSRISSPQTASRSRDPPRPQISSQSRFGQRGPEANEMNERKMGETERQVQQWQQRTPEFRTGSDAVERAPRQRDRREKDRRRSNFVYEDEFEDEASSNWRQDKKALKAEKAARKEKKAQGAPMQIYIPAFISVTNLATLIKIRTEDLVEKMADLGYGDVAHDEILNAENAGLIALEYNCEAIPERDSADYDLLPRPEADDKSLLPLRPPVVTIMGHVDHGKTTILDYLRKSSVAASEFGGITQHIGAFSVSLASGKLITFLDTPGHSAFEVMRKRGATVTDIVVLVVAGDDSVKPQTIEAIKHAKGASVPIIVAINKMDKEGANPERVKGDLARHGIDVEDFGGDVQVVCVSGKTGLGIPDLEESIVTQSEILDHRGETDGPVEGWVLESTTKRAGRVATVLVKRGSLSPGDILVAGTTWARVRVLRNEAGAQVPIATPGTPVEVDGWRALPAAGDQVLQAPNEQKATDVVSFREEKAERVKLAQDMEAINEFRRLEQDKREREAATAAAAADAKANGDVAPVPAAEVQEEKSTGPTQVNFLIKGDVAGSVEAVENSISALAHPEVRPHVLRSGVGPVSEFDVEHAAAAQGYIVCFNTTVEPGMAQMAERKGVGLIEQNVIYRLVDDVKAKLSENLKPSVSTRVLGEAEVAEEFEIGVGGRKKMKIAGCKVRNGVVNRGVKVRVLRGEREVVFDGILNSLKNVKKDVSEMRKGTECGIGFENWEEFQIGDQIQCYEERVEKRFL
ncbi:initiation factor 2 [Viridothelium virens]|uniref:Translation initiation factor IF-2, mitochondrial n=1 Tax=Viridothelium virens TaxID=1048519 RepID=A0A6A6H753_VIRVR|nr:initiation factor 2 [Viridothelium virens]